MHLVHDATHAADFFSFRRGHAIRADASSWRKMTRKRRQWHASKNTGWLNWGGTFAHVCTFNFALAESKGYYMHATSLAVLLLLSHSCAVLAAPAASEDTGVGPPPALAPEQAPPLPLARISHRIECIGAANQRNVLCHNHSRRIAERPDADRVYSGFVWI